MHNEHLGRHCTSYWGYRGENGIVIVVQITTFFSASQFSKHTQRLPIGHLNEWGSQNVANIVMCLYYKEINLMKNSG